IGLGEHAVAVESLLGEHAVEPDHPGQAEFGTSGGDEREGAAEAEADRRDRLDPGPLPESSRRGRDVLQSAVELHLLAMGAVLEALGPWARTGRAAVVVERDRVVPGLRESLGELHVERV